MNRITTLVLFVFISIAANAQTEDNKNASLDSLKELDMLLGLLDSADNPTSNFDINLGIGNKLFSQKNNSVNATQAQVNQLYYTPSVGYHHKSGLGLSVTSYIANDNGTVKIYQTALTPSYDYSGKSISASLSYSHYFADTKAYNSNSTFQDDWYASVRYKKWVIEPTIAIGYTTGKFYEVSRLDTVGPMPNVVYNDSTSNSIKDFSLNAGIEHSFEFESLFTKNDGLSLTPQLILSAGSEKYTSTRINKVIYPVLNQFLQKRAAKRGKVISRSQSDNTSFTIQSLALSLSVDYSIGKFSISPNVYSDYYLPATTEKRLNTVFSISFGYYF
jgi:hypothetical protein